MKDKLSYRFCFERGICMICKKCGENLPNNARECFTCGAKVRREVAVEPDVKTATKPAVAVVKPPRPSGEVLKEVFSSSSYLILCVFVTLGLIATIAINILMPIIAKSLDIDSSADFTDSIIGIAVRLLLTVLVWMVYFRSKSMKNPTGTDFIKIFKIMHVYAIVSLVASVVDAAISLVAMFVTLFSVSGLVSVVVGLVIAMLPNYATYQLTRSLVNSCEKGRMLLEGVVVLRVYAIISAVITIALTALFALGAIVAEPIVFIFAGAFLVNALLSLRAHNFLYLLQHKSKY